MLQFGRFKKSIHYKFGLNNLNLKSTGQIELTHIFPFATLDHLFKDLLRFFKQAPHFVFLFSQFFIPMLFSLIFFIKGGLRLFHLDSLVSASLCILRIFGVTFWRPSPLSGSWS